MFRVYVLQEVLVPQFASICLPSPINVELAPMVSLRLIHWVEFLLDDDILVKLLGQVGDKLGLNVCPRTIQTLITVARQVHL